MKVPDLPRRALLLDDARPGGASKLFRDPLQWIVATTPEEAFDALRHIDAAVARGLWVAGGFAFELGYLLEPRLRPLFRPPPDPLIAVGIYECCSTVDGAAVCETLSGGPSSVLGAAEPSLEFAAYEKGFKRVRDYIAAGDVYQINLTFPLAFPLEGNPLSRLSAWRASARAGHAAILRLDHRDVFFLFARTLPRGDGRWLGPCPSDEGDRTPGARHGGRGGREGRAAGRCQAAC